MSGRRVRTRVLLLILVWVLLLVLSLAFLSFLLSFFEATAQRQNTSSVSWAGYLISKNTISPQIEVTEVNASWVIPQVNVSAGEGYSSGWVGIGGQVDKTLIQIGTEHDVIAGKDVYSAWYELLPAFAIRIENLTICQGDLMVASIVLVNSSANIWSVQIIDATSGEGFSRNVVYNSTCSSGEWIVERPTINNAVSALADFGNISFVGCYLDINGTVGPIGQFSFSKIDMVDSRNFKLASVSGLVDNGTSFTVSSICG